MEQPPIPVKKEKKFDQIDAPETNDLFIENLDAASLVAKFKSNCLTKLTDKRSKQNCPRDAKGNPCLEVDCDQIGKFFHVKLNLDKVQWFPRSFRNEMNAQGIAMMRKRGRTFVTVTIEGIK